MKLNGTVWQFMETDSGKFSVCFVILWKPILKNFSKEGFIKFMANSKKLVIILRVGCG